jgi:hypothetical protein
MRPAASPTLNRTEVHAALISEQLQEWAYRGLPRRVLAEPFLYSSNGWAAPEAQVYTFSGKAALINILVGTKRSPERRGCWFDVTGRRVAVKRTIPYAEF